MRLTAIGTAATALILALSLPAIAHADKTVQSGGGSCENDDTCGSLAQAAQHAGAGDTITVHPVAGGWEENVTFNQGGLMLKGADGTGEVLIRGSLTFNGAAGASTQAFTVSRLVIRATSGSALTFDTAASVPNKTVSLQSLILSGAGAGAAGLRAVKQNLSVGSISITARHLTIADAPGGSAVGYAESTAGSGSITTTFHDSIVKGNTSVPGSNNDTTTAESALFVDPVNENFHLRVTSPAVNAGGTGGPGEIATDIDGEARETQWDRGADEVHHDPPSKPSLSASGTTIQTGQSVSFTASATDPDAGLGDSVRYRWVFGDGTTAETATGSTSHVYAAAGEYRVTVTAVDATNRTGPESDPVTITVLEVPKGTDESTTGGELFTITRLPGFQSGAGNRRGPDTTPPEISFAFPRAGQAVRLGPRSTAILRGRNADLSGVRRVELAVMRREGPRCRWYDGRGAFRLGRCTAPVWFKATVDDFDWYFAFPRRVRPRPGAYAAFVRATDYVGNRTTAFTAANAVAFRWAR